MARMARVVIPGVPHLVVQRGHRDETVFSTDKDRKYYLELLKEYADENKLEILAYCLMKNHLHLVVRPKVIDSLAGALLGVHLRYAQYVNLKRKQSGHVWQGRFYSCPLDEAHAREAVRYVECNPIRLKLVRKAELYPWSSAPGHTGRAKDPLLSERLKQEWSIRDWSGWLLKKQDGDVVTRLQVNSRTGRPLGDAAFIRRAEKRTGRDLQPKKPGRPKGATKKRGKTARKTAAKKPVSKRRTVRRKAR